MSPSVASWLPTAVLVPLVAFALYRRVRRTFGRQPVTPKRMIARMALFSLVSVVFLVLFPTPSGFAFAAVGAALGGVLASYGLRHTRFDVTAADKGYTTNPWIGSIVTALFVGRLAVRMFSFYEARTVTASAAPGVSFQRSPLTLGSSSSWPRIRRVLRRRARQKARTLVEPERTEP